MIDLHCHILPGLDDGAFDSSDSLAMARQARGDGIAAICATPHIRHDHEVWIEQISTRVEALQQELRAQGVDVRVLPGGELAETEVDRLTDEQLLLITLGGAGSWVLLEPASGPLGSGLEDAVAELARRGLRSVIAHPERHAGVDFQQRLRALAHAGCLIQWTAEFVAEAAPEDLALVLASEGLVHLLGSDAHSSLGGRAVRLTGGFERLATVCTPARVEWMAELAPAAIVTGKPLAPMP